MNENETPITRPEDGIMTCAEFRCLRMRMGLTAQWFAEHIHVSLISVQRWERCRRPSEMAVREILELKKRFDAEVADLAEHGGVDIAVPRSGRTLDGCDMPVGWYQMVAQAVSELRPARIVFREGEGEDD